MSAQLNICSECGGREGHTSPFCRKLNLTESLVDEEVCSDIDAALTSRKVEAPPYLVLGADGNLGGYFREDILRCDLAIHQRDGDPAVAVFKLQAGLRTRYERVDLTNFLPLSI